ncbi:MAG: phosphoribosylformylglycinamidine synthase subunit PurL [Candidatus Levybacteria bacterium]|nr:phosphoribosylformylglycinamidine synthase subunit PurL [Candidatus Levybacteria bacterium]
MVTRIEILSKFSDTRAAVLKRKLENLGFSGKIKDIWIADTYTINKRLNDKQLEQVANALTNPVNQTAYINSSNYSTVIPARRFEEASPLGGKAGIQNDHYIDSHFHGNDKGKFDFAIETGYLPGVTDNIANTTKEIIEDLLKIKFSTEDGVYSTKLIFTKGALLKIDIDRIAESLINPLIQRVHIKDFNQFKKDKGMDKIVPAVSLTEKISVDNVNLNIDDEELVKIGKSGIQNKDGSRRGPLALDLTYMKTIQAHFKKLKKNPTDIELESIAQTWSEHCKHTIFADPVDEIKTGLFKECIKKATEEIRKKKGKQDFCVSVFTDNSGAIEFDKDYLITHKVETHNSPSALDPYGGAITGIVGVNRDTIGFGLGAKPILNIYGYCVADPKIKKELYKNSDLSQKMLSPRRILDGVIEGVNSGGNCSGIPTPQGFVYFDERYQGKPLVFVGTLGLIPKKIKGKKSYIKKAKPGDFIVMIGGRVGQDGIHGATFSSEALNQGSPAAAVQIGDPITQKKLSDALIKEARGLNLYNSITDDGAGGLSCSVAEMAKESGGCIVNLEKVPLKYPGLEPWQIWISESQERMTLAVSKNKWKKFHDLLKRRGVEATIIGIFTNSGNCVVFYKEKKIMDIDMKFLHDGLPQRPMKTQKIEVLNTNTKIPAPENLTEILLKMISRPNIASFEFISKQYDYEVQGSSILKPLAGRGRINTDTTVIKPLPDSQKGVIISQGFYPSYSDIDPYSMAASSIDTAIRNIVAAGGNIEKIALLDNFCWCSPDDPKRLWQLKEAARACFDLAVEFETPFISGKDSMYNDFKGFDQKGNPIKISIPPTLLISSIGIIDDIFKTVSIDAKFAGDLIYVLGETNEEMGGSEYLGLIKYRDSEVPKVDASKNIKLYKAFYNCVNKNLIASSISINRGGLGVSLLKMAMSGMLGIEISLEKLKGNAKRPDFALFSENQGRIIVTVSPKNKTSFEKEMKEQNFSLIGKVTENNFILIKGRNGKNIIKTDLESALKAYRSTFEGY